METDYKVKLEVFEGPLDLLLYLIKRDEIDIYDISLERITKQYLEYLQAFKELNIDIAGEFIVMAANLIYLKSRSLLPVEQQPPDEEAEEDDPRWDLIRQLIEYKKFKEAAAQLQTRALAEERMFARAGLMVAGCGYAGEAAADRFHESGWSVEGWTASAESAAKLSNRPYPVRAVDVTKAEPSGNFDFVIHCVSSRGGDEKQYRRLYFEGARNLLRAFPTA